MSDSATTIALGPAIIEAVQPLVLAAVGAIALAIVKLVLSWWSDWTGQKIVLSQADSALIAAAASNEAGKIAARLDTAVFANMKIDTRSELVAAAVNSIVGADAANLKAALARAGVTKELVASLVAGEVGKLQAIATSPATVKP